jgi:hypothetical protein
MQKLMKSSRVFRALVLMIAGLLQFSCSKPQKLILVIDNSGSIAAYTQAWVEQFIQRMPAESMSHTEITIIQINSRPSLIWSGRGTRIREFQAALRQAAQASPEAGSDIFGGLRCLEETCSRPAYRSASVRIIIVSDLLHDPQVDSAGKPVKTFDDPFQFKSFPTNGKLLIYGVSPAISSKAREVWKEFGPEIYLKNTRFERSQW